MCTEFLLACLYFIVIFIINFFLYKLLKNYLENILKLQQLKIILKNNPENEFFINLYNYSNRQFLNSNTLLKLQLINSQNLDTLTLGNIYKYISNINRINNPLNEYYFQLLMNQYLPFKFNLK